MAGGLRSSMRKTSLVFGYHTTGIAMVSISRDRTQVLLTVTDTGPGIPEDLQRRIFEPFFTTKSQRGGSGLGLPLCRSIVEGHHGSIQLTSRPGQGTTVHVALPTTAPEVQAPEAAPDLTAPAPARGGAILLIDDEAIIVQSLRRLLQRDGHEVTTAATGFKGLAALEARAYERVQPRYVSK
jgi:two-component system, cell cycle sensor histidine kinase and response regulator CckA